MYAGPDSGEAWGYGASAIYNCVRYYYYTSVYLCIVFSNYNNRFLVNLNKIVLLNYIIPFSTPDMGPGAPTITQSLRPCTIQRYFI